LIYPISHNNLQIVSSYMYSTMTYEYILMYVLKFIYIICIRLYIVHRMNLKINIWTLNFLFKSDNWYINCEINILFFKKYIRIWNLIFESENLYFNCLKHSLNFKFLIWIWFFNLNSKRLIWSKIWYLNSKLIFLYPKISISIQKIY
jgi:hypothetical protein